ncbi:unnamed protein product [Caenorhabditis brenneri]
MKRFEKKVAIVTGSSNGIGRATAVLFAQEGAKVTITGRNSQRIEETKQEILKAGVPEAHVNIVVGDITSTYVQEELIQSTVDKFGRIDILVNNAGGAILDNMGSLGVNQSLDNFDETLNLNMKSVIGMTQKAIPHLEKTKGDIVNVSSIASGPRSVPDFNNYSLSKAALDQYTRNSAINLIEKGIRVNSVNPGVVVTGASEALGLPKEISEKYLNVLRNSKHCVPARFVAEPEQIAQAIAFLADRNMSSYIIGHQLVIDGGTTLVTGMNATNFPELLK